MILQVFSGLLFAVVWAVFVAEMVTEYQTRVRVLRPLSYALAMVLPWLCGLILFMSAMGMVR